MRLSNVSCERGADVVVSVGMVVKSEVNSWREHDDSLHRGGEADRRTNVPMSVNGARSGVDAVGSVDRPAEY